MKKITAILGTGLILICFSLLSQEVPFDLQAKLILKILEFDKNFDRFGDPIKIGVSSDEVLNGLNALKDSLSIKGKKFVAEKMIALADISRYKVVYIDTNWSSEYKNAAKKAIENRCLMFARDENAVINGGAAISFKTVDGKPKIVLAIAAAKEMGSEFPANFLQLAITIGSL